MQLPDLQRIEHIRDYCAEIEKTIERYGKSFDIFSLDTDYQKSVSFSILQIGELSGKLSEEFKNETSNLVPWSAIREMRNIFAHNYGSMNREIIWKTANDDVSLLLDFCNEILKNN